MRAEGLGMGSRRAVDEWSEGGKERASERDKWDERARHQVTHGVFDLICPVLSALEHAHLLHTLLHRQRWLACLSPSRTLSRTLSLSSRTLSCPSPPSLSGVYVCVCACVIELSDHSTKAISPGLPPSCAKGNWGRSRSCEDRFQTEHCPPHVLSTCKWECGTGSVKEYRERVWAIGITGVSR